MFGCRQAVVETGRVPCKGMARQLVDAKTRFLLSVSLRCGVSDLRWLNGTLCSCWPVAGSVSIFRARQLQTGQTHARGRRHLVGRRLMNEVLQAAGPGLDFGDYFPQADR